MSEDRKEDDAELEARLAKLDAAIKAREARDAAEKAPREPTEAGSFAKAMSTGLNVFSEFVGALLVGGVIGWQVDAWTGAKPWGLVGFLGLGAAAGFWNIYRLATRQASQANAAGNPDAS